MLLMLIIEISTNSTSVVAFDVTHASVYSQSVLTTVSRRRAICLCTPLIQFHLTFIRPSLRILYISNIISMIRVNSAAKFKYTEYRRSILGSAEKIMLSTAEIELSTYLSVSFSSDSYIVRVRTSNLPDVLWAYEFTTNVISAFNSTCTEVWSHRISPFSTL